MHEHLKQYDKALTDLSQAIKLDPADDQFYTERALVHLRMRSNEQALEDCNHAISFHSHHKGPTLLYRCVAHVRLGRFGDAMGDFVALYEHMDKEQHNGITKQIENELKNATGAIKNFVNRFRATS